MDKIERLNQDSFMLQVIIRHFKDVLPLLKCMSLADFLAKNKNEKNSV